MTPPPDAGELHQMQLPSYGIRRILAAVMADRELRRGKVALIDVRRPDVDAYVDSLKRFEPDLIGMSAYVWSLPCLVDVARRIKQWRPNVMIVFGGPSARTQMFDLAPYAPAHAYLDAVVSTEGEATFRDIARLPGLAPSELHSVAGLHLPRADGWRHTMPRPPPASLDDIASPFQLGLMPKGAVAYLETFRGCPLSCRFCEWGAGDKTGAVFSADYLTRELESYVRMDVKAAFLVDAGLNLNARAFRNLCEAESRVGLFKEIALWCEVYPALMNEQQLAFLRNIKAGYLGIGLQSTNRAVLEAHQRRFNDRRFEAVVRQLCDLADVEIQIIVGLPGDSPQGFLETLAFARSMPAIVRAYHCLVLPDALMSRALPEWEMDYDPLTLSMRSCTGWSAEALHDMRAQLSAAARASGGTSGDYWWSFPPPAGSA